MTEISEVDEISLLVNANYYAWLGLLLDPKVLLLVDDRFA